MFYIVTFILFALYTYIHDWTKNLKSIHECIKLENQKKKKEIYFNILLFQNCIDVKKNFNKKEYFNKNTIKKLVLDIIYRKVILNF